MTIMLGPEIKLPPYSNEQAELWIDDDCPSYTGIIAAINGIAFRRYGCYIDRLTTEERKICDDEASRIGLAWIEIPPKEVREQHGQE